MAICCLQESSFILVTYSWPYPLAGYSTYITRFKLLNRAKAVSKKKGRRRMYSSRHTHSSTTTIQLRPAATPVVHQRITSRPSIRMSPLEDVQIGRDCIYSC